jgi:hypothetical protein
MNRVLSNATSPGAMLEGNHQDFMGRTGCVCELRAKSPIAVAESPSRFLCCPVGGPALGQSPTDRCLFLEHKDVPNEHSTIKCHITGNNARGKPSGLHRAHRMCA